MGNMREQIMVTGDKSKNKNHVNATNPHSSAANPRSSATNHRGSDINSYSSTILYQEIRSIITESRNYAYSTVNFSMVLAYWHIGKVIACEKDSAGQIDSYNGHGSGVLKRVSEMLTAEFGKGFTVRNLQEMKRFYLTFSNVDELCPHLSWTHYRLLLRVKNGAARLWYMSEAEKSAWSSRELDRQISTLYYERLRASRDKDAVIQEAREKLCEVVGGIEGKILADEFIRDPYVLEFLNLKNYPSLRETDLESLLIDNLQDFLLELGRGFCFVARQKLMRYEDEDFYVDLVFYHSVLKCHVLIDLKVGKLTHADVGQMESYIRMFDDLYRNPDDNPTLGIIFCSQKNEAIVKYSVLGDAKQIFASKYILELPTPEELATLLVKERENIEQEVERDGLEKTVDSRIDDDCRDYGDDYNDGNGYDNDYNDDDVDNNGDVRKVSYEVSEGDRYYGGHKTNAKWLAGGTRDDDMYKYQKRYGYVKSRERDDDIGVIVRKYLEKRYAKHSR